MKNQRFQLDPETLKLIQVIESTEDEAQRLRAIMNLADQGGMNAARILIETFERSMWRETKMAIVQALGRVPHERSLEFLCRLASDQNDCGLASEAVLSLGAIDHPVAGEFLASIVRTRNHPLLREALIALANQNFFPCEQELATILDDSRSDLPPAVRQNAIIAAGLRGYRRFLPAISEIIKSNQVGPLFNTAIMALGRIGNQSSFEMLEHLDTRYRSFAHQLKLAALDHLRLSATYTVEDAVQAILLAKSRVAQKQAWVVLGGFTTESAREALQLLGSDGDVVAKTLERVFLFDSNQLHEDLRFLSEHIEQLPSSIFAALGRMHALNQSSALMIAALRKIGDGFFVRFTATVRIDKVWVDLISLVGDAKASIANRQYALNSLISQYLMSAMEAETRDAIGKQLIRTLETLDHEDLSSRVIRAIGQLRYSGPDSLNFLRENLKRGYQSEASYSALAMCESDDAVRIITKRLRQILPIPNAATEVRMAIHSLARSERACDATCLALISQSQLEEMRVAVLKILTLSPAEELREFVATCLATGDFQTKILAVAAAKHLQSEVVADGLFVYLDHSNQALAGRALDSLVTSFGAGEHLRIFERMRSRYSDEGLYKKVFRSLVPREGDSYKGVLTILDMLIRERKGIMSDQDMVQSALNLRDNLVVMTALAPSSAMDLQKSRLKEIDRHAIDEFLGRSLRGFDKYSATIKSVLRSGEVTWQHPELFDARVDKSTVLVQYVKAIDLLLQEKIGSQMFLGNGASFLQKMQSRVIRLELDEESSWDGQLIGSLDCGMYFSRDSFPAHKLMSICRTIMTGQIMKEQYKVVDGLRAWAVLLLLFGRPFKFRGQLMESLFPTIKSSNDGVCRIARAMNDLQEARNRAAHRGTVLEKDNIKELRDLSSALLNDLDAHFSVTN